MKRVFNYLSVIRHFPGYALQLDKKMALSPLDPSSYSRPEYAVVKHINLALNVDFEGKILKGQANLLIDVHHEVKTLDLDVSDLAIESIHSGDNTNLSYDVTGEVKDYGSKLSINLSTVAYPGDKLNITIKYATSPSARALQWLEPSQTSGKQQPYLFSQCQPIHARTIVPCQDTPAVKFTYNAEITAPEQFTVLMSALRQEKCEQVVGGKKTSFKQPVPIPSYLLAIAVGPLQSKRLGPRSLVWAEKEDVERSAWEFAETEKYLKAAEALCGPYVWGQYDLLVLPPSFPYGGMENPCLTFVTPTLLAGDRSQAEVIVHEIMHSWTGNLVTNCNFEHFWLNEGFTVFLERKVGGALVGGAAGVKERDFQSLLGLQTLNDTINNHLGPTNPLTKLVVNLTGVHPDDAFSSVPYEKGSLFLRYLEDLVGGPAVFDVFLRSYFNTFKMKSLNTDQFRQYLLGYFPNNADLRAVDWRTWLDEPGFPPVIPAYDTSLSKECIELANRIHSGPLSSITADDIKNFNAHQIIKVLEELLVKDPMPTEKIRHLGTVYNLKNSQNCELLFRFLRMALKSKDSSFVQATLDFVNRQGRMKYVRPLYRELYAWEEMRQRAIDNFLENEKYMMHVSAHTLRKDLHLSD